MKKNYLLQDGGKITATCAAEFVTALREGSFFDSQGTDQEYMESFAARFKDYSGNDLRTDTPDNFLEDLIKYDYAKIEE
ncbi:MAG: hypothetical protein LIP01_07145 [Tannerellaceae bacterium]|nr:hypothetical protein [Tannerellaceae bacterium]